MGELFACICSEESLFDAWRRIERKGSQGGIDRITVAAFGQRLNDNLEQLRSDLLHGRYVPEPFHKIEIPKPNDPGETRPLRLPTVRDKIAQEAVRSVIAPILEKTFVDCSYAYRPGKGPQKAIRRVEHYLSAKKSCVAIADIDRFFDTMQQELTLHEVEKHIAEPEITRLLALWISMGAMDTRGRWVDALLGVAQGSVISPLLSNVYLTPFDTYLTQKGHALVRYADNFILLAGTPAAAMQAMEEADTFLQQRLHLQLNAHPRLVTSLAAGFVFLGIYFRDRIRRISEGKVQKMQAELRNLWHRYAAAEVPTLVAELNESILGWQRYYGMVQPTEQFRALDAYIAEGLARALALRLTAGKVARNAELSTMIQDLQFLSPTPPPQRKAALEQIVRRARGLHARPQPLSSPAPQRQSQEKEPVAAASALVQPQRPLLPLPPGEGRGEGPQDPEKASLPPADSPTAPATLAQASAPVPHADAVQQVASAVRKQKRRYLQEAVQTSELIIAEPGVFLGKTSRRVVVKKQRRVVMEMPLRQLRHIIITSPGVTLSSAVITFCAQGNVPIDFFTPRGDPLARLSAPLDALGSTSLRQLQAIHDGSGLRLAHTFVVGKLKNQLNLVKYYHKYRKRVDEDFARTFTEVEQKFDALQAALQAYEPVGDYETVRHRLFAFEGQGGNLYWQMMRVLLADDVEFTGRERQGATDLVNSLLNYGYGMLYPRVHHALLLAGLHPGISFLHSFQDGKPSLAFDLIEEFRAQAVDRVVFSMLTKGEALAIDTQTNRLTKETVQKLMRNVLERLATPIRYRSADKPLQDIIHLQAKLLAAHLHGKVRYRSFIGQW